MTMLTSLPVQPARDHQVNGGGGVGATMAFRSFHRSSAARARLNSHCHVIRSGPMDAYRAVVDKRDQRAFVTKPLPDETLRRILQAGRMTGSSKNREPNRFVVVRDRERRSAIAGLSRFARWLADAAVVVVIVQTE